MSVDLWEVAKLCIAILMGGVTLGAVGFVGAIVWYAFFGNRKGD